MKYKKCGVTIEYKLKIQMRQINEYYPPFGNRYSFIMITVSNK